MLNASSRRQCWLSRHSRAQVVRCCRSRHRVMSSSQACLRHRHSLPATTSLDADTPRSPGVTLRCLPLYSELSGVLDVLRTPAGTAAASQRASTFCYDRHLSRTSVTAADLEEDLDEDEEDRETRLTKTIQTVVPLLTANIGVLSNNSSSVEERCLALDELLYLVEGAWSMPVIGREVAYRVCDVLREQGGVDMLLTNMNTRTTDAANMQPDDVIALMSAIVLSQVGLVYITSSLSHSPSPILTV